MAVEIKNKRKRKHDDSLPVGDDLETVPKKRSKKSLTPKKKTPESDCDEDFQHDSGFNTEEKEIKFSKDFKMMEFRTKLRGPNFITELRHFIHLCQNRPKTIAKYIEKRGKPLEIVDALDRVDKSNVLHIAYICEALQFVILEILSNQHNHLESAAHASRYFLKSHGSLLELLLKSAVVNHRKIALKLLTAIVCVEPQLGRQVLSSYDILSNVKNINQFLSHHEYEIQQQQSGQDVDTVRKCFIHFVLSYLVDGNLLLIRNILDRGSLIRSLVSGLLYDDAATVCMVLSTLKKYVLECPEISKTKKIHVFDFDCCKSFVQLYDWMGPKVFAVKNSGKKDAKNLNAAQLEEFINPPDKETVSKAVHAFLVVLLTSRKFGITFDTVKFFRQKHNTIQGQIMGYLRIPWSDERKTDLVLKILESCPDLFRNTVRNFAGIINPMRTASRFWLQAIEFLTKIITACHPSHLNEALDKLTLTDFSYWIKEICLPLETLVHINGQNFLSHTDFQFRLATNHLLLAMFQQYTNYMKIINQKQQNKGTNSLRRFRFDILNHLLLNFPTMEQILLSLNMSINLKKKEEEEDVLVHLNIALDLILILCQESRSFVNKTGVILNYLELLRPLYSHNEDESMPIAAICDSKIKLEMKAIKIILWIFPKAIEPDKPRFSSVLKSLMRAFVFGQPDVSREAGALIHNIFKNTGIFESGELEIDIWLESLKFFDANTVDVVSQVFNEVLQVTQVEVDIPKTLENTTNQKNLQTLFENIENGLYVQAYVESLNISKLMPLIFKGVELISPLSRYLEIVCFLMFHYYPCAENVLVLYQQQFKNMTPFMQAWLKKEPTKETNLCLEKNASHTIPCLKDIQALVLFGQKSFAEIFESKVAEDVCEVEFMGNMKKFSVVIQQPRLLMTFMQCVLFEVQQLKEKEMLTQPQTERAANFVTNCLDMIIKFSKDETQSTQSEDNETTLNNELYIHKLLKYIYGARFLELKSTELISAGNISECYKSYLNFVNLITEYCNKLDKFDNYAENFKQKLVKAVAVSFNNKEDIKNNTEHFEEFNNLLKVFNLNKEHCTEILQSLMDNLSYKDFFVIDSNNQKSIYYNIMVTALQRLADLKKSINCPEFVNKFCKTYSNFFKKLQGDFNVELLEDAFYNFLLSNHQLIQQLDKKFFESFFQERKLTKSCIKLAILVFERQQTFNEIFQQNLEANLDKKELMYPLIDLAFKKELPLEPTILQKIYQNYKNGFMRTIEKPLKAGMIYKDNVATSLKLIELCMPLTECKDFCNKQFKFEHIETYQLRTIYKIYEKAFLNSDLKQKSSIFVNFVTLQVQMMSLDLKMQKLNEQKLLLCCHHLQEWFKYGKHAFDEEKKEPDSEHEPQELYKPNFSKLLKTQQWLQFCKTCLKTGLHVNESDVEVGIKDDKFNGLLLKLLAFLADNLYDDCGEEVADTSANLECAQIYEMIFTHSKFYDIVLTKPSQSWVKTQTLHLLFIMVKKAPYCLQELQIPVILGAYQAKLYDSDRYCLALLNMFEYYDCNLNKYRPFIWGESAIAFYELKANDEERAKLSQPETSIQQVMSLVDRQISEYTIDNFPIWRKLNTLQQLPEVHFEDPFNKAWQFGANILELKLESNLFNFEESELRLCPKRPEVFEQCYDPAFFVPLMSMCFSPESYAHPARPVQNGLLAITFAALSAQDKEMRQAAGCVQQRYRHHFENGKFFEKPLWLQTYENIQSGLNDLRNSWIKHKTNSGTPRIPFISGLFVAKTFNLTTDPTHLLYKQLTMYLRLKSSFNFQCIPEFNILFYSPEVEHQEFRQFIVEVIKNGIKSSSDLFLLVSTNTFKVLMGFYGSTMSTLELNLQILSVFSTCVKIPASSKIMIEHVGILPWLSSIVTSIEFYQFDVIEGLISNINNLWYAVKANEKEFHNFQHLQLEMHRLILQLLPLISPRISISNFAKLMNIFNKTCLHSSQHLALSAEQLHKLISCAEKHFGTLVLPLKTIFENGGAGCTSLKDFCQELYNQQEESKAILALSSLRDYLINWWYSNNNNKTALVFNESLIQ